MNLKIPAKELKPGMVILYRLQWYEFLAYSADDKQIMFKNAAGEIISKMVHPNFPVTVKPGDLVCETRKVGKSGLGFYYSHEKCWSKHHPGYAHTLSMCGNVDLGRGAKAELGDGASFASDPGCVYCNEPLKKGA